MQYFILPVTSTQPLHLLFHGELCSPKPGWGYPVYSTQKAPCLRSLQPLKRCQALQASHLTKANLLKKFLSKQKPKNSSPPSDYFLENNKQIPQASRLCSDEWRDNIGEWGSFPCKGFCAAQTHQHISSSTARGVGGKGWRCASINFGGNEHKRAILRWIISSSIEAYIFISIHCCWASSVLQQKWTTNPDLKPSPVPALISQEKSGTWRKGAETWASLSHTPVP